VNKKNTNITNNKRATPSKRAATPKRAVVSKNRGVLSIKKNVALKNHVTQYVLPLGNGWVVKNSNVARFTFITDSKREAITIARSLARSKHMELIVHGKNGNIEVKESYIL
jgi:Uncharacterized protein conserved in bacteria (DUF2188)